MRVHIQESSQELQKEISNSRMNIKQGYGPFGGSDGTGAQPHVDADESYTNVH